MPDVTQALLPMPAGITDGAVVSLACGRTYQGTLDLRGRSHVTVNVSGTCGKPVLSPGQPITGWTPYQGGIWSAPVSFTPAQAILDGQPMSLAHWPSTAQTWATPTATTATSLTYALPNADVVGARLVFKAFDWAIESRTITAYAGNVMTLADSGNPSFGGYALSGTPPFYVEGKLWMLDEPGEWAYANGRLYVWTPDGASPEGRFWASPDSPAIAAGNASDIRIDGVRLFGAANAIDAVGAAGLRVTGSEIVDSSENGIVNSGGSGLVVDSTTIRNTRHDGVIVKWGGAGTSITQSVIDASGILGMPTNARAAIALTAGDGVTLSGNRVTNSGYIGMRFFRNATVTNNVVDAACKVMSDCGGMYVSAPDQQPLNTVISGNTVSNTSPGQRLSWGLQMDDHANAVTVSGNQFSGNANALMNFDGFNNVISANRFDASSGAHIQMAEDGSTPSVRNNSVSGNYFITRDAQETYRLSSDMGAASVSQFASYGNNTYATASSVFANFNGSPYSYSQWQSATGDTTSQLASP